MSVTFDSIIGERQNAYRRNLIRGGVILLAVGMCLAHSGLFDVNRLTEGGPALLRLLGEMLPPDFSNIGTWGKPLLDTLAMSVAGTFLAVCLSIPIGFLAATNSSPNPAVRRMARGVLNFLRSVPELIMGIVFVAAVGFGALPGVLALGLHSVGMVGKFFAESVEHCDVRPVEAVRAAGASRLQVILHGMLPQVIPQMADITVYRWEYNFRASTVMGMVGAGGIGFELMASLRLMQYQEVAAILLVILAMVTVVDALGSWLRRKFV
jgi:phosphonate transport system permease protein